MTSESNLKPMPSAEMAEKSAISIILKNKKILARAISEGIDDDCFHDHAVKIIWGYLRRYDIDHPTHEEVDLGLLIQKMTLEGKLEQIGGASKIAEIWTYAPSEQNFSEWCEILREMKARRITKKVSTKLDECEDSQEAIHTAKMALEALQGTIAGKSRATTAKEAARVFLEKLKQDHEAGEYPGAKTSIYHIDHASGGMRPGELWVIAGKPSQGKSVLMLQIAEAFASRGDTTAIFSLEMMSGEIIARLCSVMGRIQLGAITQPRTASKKDLEAIQAAARTLCNAPLWIDTSAGQSIDTITAEAERIRDKAGKIDLVVVDYLQLMRGNRTKGETREEEVARVSGGLKQLAKKLECPVLTASQLNDDGKTRESRAIEQDADVLLGIFEEGIKIGKMRNGERNKTLPLRLNGAMQKFELI